MDEQWAGVFARRFDAFGIAAAPELQVNTYTESSQAMPSIISDQQGNCVIAWGSLGQSSTGWNIYAERVLTDGTRIGVAPTAKNDTITVDQNSGPTAIDVLINDSDPDTNDQITIQSSSTPNNGTVELTGAPGAYSGLSYTPAANYYGEDSFTYTIRDTIGNTSTATVNVLVARINSAPVVEGQDLQTDEDTPKSVLLSATDADGDPLTYRITTPPTDGTLSGEAPNLVYTPSHNYNGNDSFTFVANDGFADSNSATVKLTINSVNDAPVAQDIAKDIKEDVGQGFPLRVTDVEGDALTYSIVSTPQNGTVSLQGNYVNYRPAANYFGQDSFTFKANDGKQDSNVAVVSFEIQAVNDAPVARANHIVPSEDAQASFTLLGSYDVEGNPLTYSVTSLPSRGTLSGTAPNLTYIPEANFNGFDSFTYKVNDGELDSAAATVTLEVRAVNDAPVATAQSVSLDEDTVRTISLNASDVDGDALTYTIVAQPTKGTLSGSGANLTYTPKPNAHGADSFTFKANDAKTDSTPATVNIIINPINDAPVAVNDVVSTAKNTAITIAVRNNDTDADGDTLTVTSVTKPANGSTTILNGTSIRYTPNRNFTGTNTFNYSISDGKGGVSTATVTVTVRR
jgi:large repetitive protein